MAGRIVAAVLAFLISIASGVAGQEPPRPPFLLLNQERLLTESMSGKALLAEEEAAREELRARAREIEGEFEAEEQRLTEERAEMDAADFRKRAKDFDKRVIEARREQDERAAALAQGFDQRRRQFYAAVGPILVRLMEEVGALAVFDESAVLLSDQGLNITGAVIEALDRPPAVEAPTVEERPAADAPAAPPAGRATQAEPFPAPRPRERQEGTP
jgi:Skp family chaperone for outer membrane proteins